MTAAEARAASELGRLDKDRGRAAEQWVVDALLFMGRHWPWFRTARLATRAEDCEQIDVVVETKDLGPLYVQVKSNGASAAAFNAGRAPDQKPVVLAVHATTNQVDLEDRLRVVIGSLRRRALKRAKRNAAQDVELRQSGDVVRRRSRLWRAVDAYATCPTESARRVIDQAIDAMLAGEDE